MTDVRGRTAFITGGANGIGLGIARALASRGVKLGLADVELTALKRAQAELSSQTPVEVVQLDVRDRKGFEQAADAVESALGHVSLLINNAGVAGGGDLKDLTFELWDWCIGINLYGVINGLQTFLPRMLARTDGGHVLNTASASGLVGGTASIPYCTAKFGVVGLSESLRPALKAAGIGISVLCPGPVATSILSNSAKMMPAASGPVASAKLRDARMSSVLKDGASPDEVGRMAAAAIARNQMYVHTDRFILPALHTRHLEIVDSMPPAATDTGEGGTKP